MRLLGATCQFAVTCLLIGQLAAGSGHHDPGTEATLPPAGLPATMEFRRTDYPVGASPWAVVLADFDEDGYLDVAVAGSADSTIAVMMGNASGQLEQRLVLRTPSPLALAVGDVDRDGHLDLASADYGRFSGSASVWRGDGSGHFSVAPESYPTGAGARSIALADLNGDDWPDLVVANMHAYSLSVYLNDGTGAFVGRADLTTSSAPYSIALRDFDHDGAADLAVAREGADVEMLWGDGAGGFPARTYEIAGSATQWVEAADLDTDGNIDLAVANYASNDFWVLLGDGARRFIRIGVGLPDGARPHAVTIGDVDVDGILDLVVPSYNLDTVSVLLGDGSGIFRRAQHEYPTGPSPVGVMLGDIDGFGVPDIVVANAGAASLTVLHALHNTPPHGEAVTIDAVAGSAASLTFEMADDATVDAPGSIVGARLVCRPGGGGAAVAVDSTTRAGDDSVCNWTAVVPAELVTERGLEYALFVSDPYATVRIPDGSAWLTAPVRIDSLRALRLEARTYQLAGVPLVPADPSPETIFRELGPYDGDGRSWRYWTWDAMAVVYRELGAAAPARTGQGFWIVAQAAADIHVSGTSTPLTESFAIPLQPGWNMVANPFAFPVGAESISYPANSEYVLRSWDPSLGYTIRRTMEPARGYFLYLEGPDPDSLRIAPVAAASVRRADSHREARRDHDLASSWLPGFPAEADDGWCVRVEATSGGHADLENWFGQVAGASTGKDRSDLVEAPAAPGDYVRLSFVISSGQALTADFHGLGGDGEPGQGGTPGATWSLALDSNLYGQEAAVVFAVEKPLPVGWRLVAIDTASLALTDLLAEPVLAVRAAGGLAPRQSWRVAAGPDAYIENIRRTVEFDFDRSAPGAILAYPRPNPFVSGGETEIALASPRRQAGLVRVYDVRGRLVRELYAGELARGWQRFLWNGRDGHGQPVSSGLYLIQAVVGGENRLRKVLLVR